MTTEPERPEPGSRLRWTAGAIALLVIGLVILIPSGLCTSIALVAFATTGSNMAERLHAVLSVLSIGGPFILVGFVLFWLGLRARKWK